ncbi:MAG: hypothetical protein N3A53_05205 [Verrucomicrobiae bacterium]|nr:hypothetical protein [Verrucomicrobiae bacterium]
MATVAVAETTAATTNWVPLVPTPAPPPRPAEPTIIQPLPAQPLQPIDPLSPPPPATKSAPTQKFVPPPTARELAGKALQRDPYFATPLAPLPPTSPGNVNTNEIFDPLDDPTGRPVTNRPPRRVNQASSP